MSDYSNTLIFGKNPTEKIVSIEVVDDQVVLYFNDGSSKTMKNYYYILAPKQYDSEYKKLKGDLHYKYIRLFEDLKEYQKVKGIYKRSQKDYFSINDARNAIMTVYGLTLFKGLKISDISVLSFDLESNGLVKNDDSTVFMISNTFRGGDGQIERKVFRVDEFSSCAEMIEEWSIWVTAKNPTALVGHNILGYDLPFLRHCLQLEGKDRELYLGRDGSAAVFNDYESTFRVSGNEEWQYHDVKVHGRHILDTMFLAVKYDIGRKFPSWGLKPIIQYEITELEKIPKKKWTPAQSAYHSKLSHGGNRQFYDSSKIRHDWKDLEKREKIIAYGMADSDDALTLFDLMMPSFFYYTQSIPMTFQNVNNSATGKQMNSLLVRSYLQLKHSIPKGDEKSEFQGAISFGISGIYKNAIRFDVSSLYPSVILQYQIYDKEKDPEQNFLKMVDYFTAERLRNKKLAKTTGEKYYDDLQASQKISINSCYGLLGAPGLNFNSAENATLVTRYGREVLQKAIMWASGKTLEGVIG